MNLRGKFEFHREVDDITASESILNQQPLVIPIEFCVRKLIYSCDRNLEEKVI